MENFVLLKTLQIFRIFFPSEIEQENFVKKFGGGFHDVFFFRVFESFRGLVEFFQASQVPLVVGKQNQGAGDPSDLW